jgi:hypothetical protein
VTRSFTRSRSDAYCIRCVFLASCRNRPGAGLISSARPVRGPPHVGLGRGAASTALQGIHGSLRRRVIESIIGCDASDDRTGHRARVDRVQLNGHSSESGAGWGLIGHALQLSKSRRSDLAPGEHAAQGLCVITNILPRHAQIDQVRWSLVPPFKGRHRVGAANARTSSHCPVEGPAPYGDQVRCHDLPHVSQSVAFQCPGIALNSCSVTTPMRPGIGGTLRSSPRIP